MKASPLPGQLDMFADDTLVPKEPLVPVLTGAALEIKLWIDGTIVPGLPSYVKDIVKVQRGTLPSGFGGKFKYTVNLIVFDGKSEALDVTPAPPGGGGCCQWHKSAHGEFHWDEDVRAWVRLPLGWELAA